MQKPFFSVVIPTLNEEKYLPDLLEDLLAQSFTDFDVWVCDGKSNDQTQRVVKTFAKHDRRIHLCVSNIRNAGAQRNRAARSSSGKYVLFLDADARIPAYFLEGVHYHILRDAFDVWSNFARTDSTKPKDKLNTYVLNLWAELSTSANAVVASGSSMGASREAFDAIGGFDEKLTFVEDHDFARRAIKKNYTYSLLKDPEFVYNFRRIHKDGFIAITMGLLPTIIKILKNEKITDPVKAYPMLGGAYFDTNTKPKKHSLTKHMNMFTATIKRRLKKQDKEIRKLLREAIGDF